jgi:succinate dehydrogenase/fumarate reductase flavoprotein subunit
MHGANRLGGNSLSAVFVMGGAAGWAAALAAREPAPRGVRESDLAPRSRSGGASGPRPADLAERLRSLMGRSAGILRTAEGLQAALAGLDALETELDGATVADAADLRRAWEVRGMLLVSRAVCRAALMRRESRGAHFRSDYPRETGDWARSIRVRLRGGQIETSLMPARQPI